MASSAVEGKSEQKNDANTFAATLMDQVNREDIPSMVYIQREMLDRFEKTNEMLINFNMLSLGRYEATVKDFQKHTHLLYDMKRDLDSIFKRIRLIKARLEKNYPEAFAACNTTYYVASDDEEEEIEQSSEGKKQVDTEKPETTKENDEDRLSSKSEDLSSSESKSVEVSQPSAVPSVKVTKVEPNTNEVTSLSPKS